MIRVIVGMKFEIDEKDIEPRPGNRCGGKVEVAFMNLLTQEINRLFSQGSSVKLTHTNVVKEV